LLYLHLTTSLLSLTRSPPDILLSFFNDPATTEIYTLSLHDALPISERTQSVAAQRNRGGSFHLRPARTARHHAHPRWSKGERPKIGRRHVWTPVTDQSRMPSFACKKKKAHYGVGTYTTSQLSADIAC